MFVIELRLSDNGKLQKNIEQPCMEESIHSLLLRLNSVHRLFLSLNSHADYIEHKQNGR